MTTYRRRHRRSLDVPLAGIIVSGIAAIIVLLVFVAAFWAWVLMLVAGAIHLTIGGHLVGFWTAYPAGLLLALVLGTIQGSRA